jgi:hypothetical protein
VAGSGRREDTGRGRGFRTGDHPQSRACACRRSCVRRRRLGGRRTDQGEGRRRSKSASAPAKGTPPPRGKVSDSTDVTWDNREINEDDPGPGEPGGPESTPAAPKAPTTLVVPVSFSIPVGRKFKYVEIEKVKIEGELKLSSEGDAGTAQASGRVEVPLDKKKPVRGVKFEVDLNKLKELVLGDIKQSSEKSDWKVDPKLECKVTTEEVNVALSITVANGWYTGSTKFVALAKSKGKDTQFASFDVSPFGYQIAKRPIELGGMKAMVSGKITVSVVLKPAWATIAADVASKIGRPVLSTLGSVATVEAAIVAGFVAIAAAQIFVFVKSVGEWQDVKACAKAAENGWLSFMSGFCSAYGVTWPDGGVAALRQAGAQAGKQHMQARLKSTRERLESEGSALPKDFDTEYIAELKGAVARNPDGLAGWVEKNMRRRVINGFLASYEQEHSDDYQFKSNFTALRTLLGVT